MTRHINLVRDGYEATADHIKSSIIRQRGIHTVIVLKNGEVRMYPHRNISESDEPYIVGTYTRTTLTEHIEDDLMIRLRELNSS